MSCVVKLKTKKKPRERERQNETTNKKQQPNTGIYAQHILQIERARKRSAQGERIKATNLPATTIE